LIRTNMYNEENVTVNASIHTQIDTRHSRDSSEIISPMKTTLLATGLGFPEGPVVMPDGRIVLCDGNIGELLVYANDSVSPTRVPAALHGARVETGTHWPGTYPRPAVATQLTAGQG
jgi:hypothetical protein